MAVKTEDVEFLCSCMVIFQEPEDAALIFRISKQDRLLPTFQECLEEKETAQYIPQPLEVPGQSNNPSSENIHVEIQLLYIH